MLKYLTAPGRNGENDAVLSNDIICDIQGMKRLKFSTKKCRLLKINSKANDDTVSGEKVEIKNSLRYLGTYLIPKVITLTYVKIG